MTLQERIQLLDELKNYILSEPDELQQAITTASFKNKWFTEEYIHLSLRNLANNFLDKVKLENWLANYTVHPEKNTQQKLGIVMAGNIPLVGFHDFLCGFITGHNLHIKLSSKDDTLLPVLARFMFKRFPELENQIFFVERIKKPHKIIATGDDNTHRYFEYYFRNYKCLLRKNRNSVAILTGNESPEQIARLAKDVFTYFGLGCRSVSSLIVPENYDFGILFENWKGYDVMMDHDGYKNNYDYHTSILLLSQRPHLTSGFLTIYEHEHLSSPMSCLHYHYWTNAEQLTALLKSKNENIQCVVSETKIDSIQTCHFGESQYPDLSEYADNADTLAFLLD